MAPKNSKKAAEAAPPAPESDVEMDYGSPSNEGLIDENSPQELAKKEQRIRVVGLTLHGVIVGSFANC
jgi:hypothetical protein